MIFYGVPSDGASYFWFYRGEWGLMLVIGGIIRA